MPTPFHILRCMYGTRIMRMQSPKYFLAIPESLIFFIRLASSGMMLISAFGDDNPIEMWKDTKTTCRGVILDLGNIFNSSDTAFR